MILEARKSNEKKNRKKRKNEKKERNKSCDPRQIRVCLRTLDTSNWGL